MMGYSRLLLATLLLSLAPISLAQESGAFSTGGPGQCLGCHDFGPDSPVHPVMAGAHGEAIAHPTAEQRGCEDCHGPSGDHTRAPTQVPPGVSFGPRWSASATEQNQQCLACHESNVAAHWHETQHSNNNLTCVTCHDIHQAQDKVLASGGQIEVCGVCHKAQKDGMHGLKDKVDANPDCTSCHNPHSQESALAHMLDNRSEGCRTCHDLVQMANSDRVSARAKSYHKIMVQQDRTCLDCHGGVAHAPAGSVAPMVPVATRSRRVTLFYPGQASTDWLLEGHPGSQPLRQGTNCQQCHRGDEAQMGNVGAGGDISPASRDMRVSVASSGNALALTLSWQGPSTDVDLAIMWDNGGSESFRRGGCFAACHNDLPGMSRDRGQQLSKYLWASRSQQQRIGQPPITKTAAELDTLMAAGNFIEVWRVDLASGETETAALLASLDFTPSSDLEATTSYSNGRWTVTLRRPLDTLPGLKDFDPARRYTLGIALHGADNPGAGHWVSLPMTLSFGGTDTDFTAE